MNASTLRFCGTHMSLITSELCNYQPTIYPPPDDFYVSVDSDGKPLSKYCDERWDFHAYSRSCFNFKIQKLTPKNKDLLKQVTFLYLYHMPLFPGAVKSIQSTFKLLSKLCKFADLHNITIDQIYRFPRLANDLIDFLSPPQHRRVLGILNALLRAENVLGWKIADVAFIEKLVQLQISHIPVQNAYIPPRIWMSLIRSTELVMDAFEMKQAAFAKAWTWVHDAYRHNIENGHSQKSPFVNAGRDTSVKGQMKPSRSKRRVYRGGANAFIEDYGIADLLNRWVGYIPSQKYELQALSVYANLVRDCAFTFILAHSIQRLGEGLSMRSDCFIEDDDPTLGKVALLVGETTKTDPDSDARWVVPTSVERAVKILNFFSRLRLDTTFKVVPQDVQINPYLMTGKIEHWGSGTSSIKVYQWSLGKFVELNPLAFPEKEFIITKDDYNIAYQLTPTLTEKLWFKVGGSWSFNAHQLRRTLAVNLFASNVPDEIIQWMMKHKTVYQSYYYGRNYTRLITNANASDTVTVEANRSAVRELIEIAENSIGDSVHATGKNLIAVNTLKLIEERDYKKLEELAKSGEASCRRTLLGFCMTQSCEYGGVESAVHCAGVDGKGPCKDAVFSKRNEKGLKALYDANAIELTHLIKNTPRHSKLKAENEAIEVYFHATSQKC